MLPYKPLRLGWQRFGAKKLQQMESVANWPAAAEEGGVRRGLHGGKTPCKQC